MKKLLAFLMAIMVFATMAAGCGGSSDKKDEKKPAAQKFINIATGGTAGTYFPLGGAIADILNKNVPGANASAQSTGASVANINLLQQDKAEITVHIPLTVHFATGNLLQDGILKALIQPHLISYMQVVNR